MQEEIVRLQQEKDSLTDALVEEKTANSNLNSHIEGQVRGRLRDDLKQMGCTYGAEELGKMSLDELKTLKRHYTFFNPPTAFKSGADIVKPRRNIYDSLYEKYIPLDERIKQMREN